MFLMLLSLLSAPQPAFILQPTSLVSQPPKTKEPPRYEDAVKQTRNMHINNITQVRHSHTSSLGSLLLLLASGIRFSPTSLRISPSVIQPLVFYATGNAYWSDLTLLAVSSGSHGN